MSRVNWFNPPLNLWLISIYSPLVPNYAHLEILILKSFCFLFELNESVDSLPARDNDILADSVAKCAATEDDRFDRKNRKR